jgi:PhnB protein
MAVKPSPEGYHSVTPYLVIKGAAKALDYYKRVFDATEVMRMDGPNGAIMHAEIKIGDSFVMLSDEFPDRGARGPEALGGSPVGLMVYVPDVDSTYKKAVDNGAKVIQAVENQFYGDRSGTVVDPFGHKWFIATHVEDVTPEEMEKRMAAMAKG